MGAASSSGGPARWALSARLAAALGIAGAVAASIGVAGASSAALSPFVGFRIFGLGLLLGLGAFASGAVGLLRTRPRSGRSGRGQAWLGLALGAAMLAAAALGAAPGVGLPAINDITTDPGDPPRFEAARRQPANVGREMAYPPAFAEIQRGGYPDLAPLVLPGVPPAEALARAERAARGLGWTVLVVDPVAGTLEANQTSRLFRFVDDVVVRVRPADGGAGARIDVRSKSRDGRGDVGANARRIRAFLARVQGEA